MIIIGMKTESEKDFSKEIAIPTTLYYDFDRPGWLDFPRFDLSNQSISNAAVESISIAIVMGKESFKIYACLILFKYSPDLLENLAYLSIQSYDLSNQQYGQWTTLQTYQVPIFHRKYPMIHSFKGELYFTDPLHGIRGYMIQKSILNGTNEDPKNLVSVIPYLGYE